MIQAVLITMDKEMAALTQQALEGQKVKLVACCQTLKGAIEIFRQESVKLVILDLFLGDTSGLDAIKTLKKMDETLDLILFSRVSSRSLLERAFRFGAGDTLIYPCGLDVLRHTIAHRLERIDDGMIVFHEN